MKQHGTMGAVFIIKQPLLTIKIYLTFADFLPRSSSLSGSYPEVLLLIWPWCISFLSASSSLSVNDSSLWVRCSLKFNPKSSSVSWSHRTELWLVTLDSSLGKKAFLLFCKHQELHDCVFSRFLSCIQPHPHVSWHLRGSFIQLYDASFLAA